MAKLFFVTLCVALVGVLAEPPSSYFPPQARNQPSRSYGAPQHGSSSGGFGGQQRSSGRSYSYNSLAENQFGGSSRSSNQGRFSHSHDGPSQQYGAPRQQQPSQQYGAPRQQPSQQYGAPRQQPSQQYGAPARQQPSQQYGAPSQGFDDSVITSARFNQRNNGQNGHGRDFGASHGNHYSQQPSQQYSAPARQYQPTSSYSAPAPRNQPSTQYGAPSSEYGAPFGKSKMDDDLAEPANYEYNYEVQAAEESGAEFGHQETREDDRAQGEYHVLLPDGRMQIVEYEADEEGFRPKIRYEETGYPDARDNQQGPY